MFWRTGNLNEISRLVTYCLWPNPLRPPTLYHHPVLPRKCFGIMEGQKLVISAVARPGGNSMCVRRPAKSEL